MIKILVIVNAVFGYDGISNVATNYYIYQDKTEVEMDLLTINPINEELKNRIQTDGRRHFVVEDRNHNPIRYIARVKKIIKEGGYDIVYVHGNSATMAVELFAAKLAGCKVRVAHSHNTQCDHKIINKILMPFFSGLYTDCCACSEEAGQFLFGSRECYIVKNGLYLPKYLFDEKIRNRIRERYGLKNKFVIGHIGRFAVQKNHVFLLNVFKKIHDRRDDAVLLLVGEGELSGTIKKMVADLKLDDAVIFYGTTDRVNEVVQAMDCFVFPSKFEGLGIVAIEAQASGLACVASDAVPKSIKINSKTSFLSLEDPAEIWCERIINSYIDPEERKQSITTISEEIKTQQYDIEKNCVEMKAYYQRILNK